MSLPPPEDDPFPLPPLPPLPASAEPPPIPEVLARPVDHPRAAEILGQGQGKGHAARMAQSWGIAMNFAFAVIGMGALGWAVQAWLWPAARPWPLLVGLGVGLVGGFVQFVRAGLAANRS